MQVTCWDHACQPSTGDIPTEFLLEFLIWKRQKMEKQVAMATNEAPFKIPEFFVGIKYYWIDVLLQIPVKKL